MLTVIFLFVEPSLNKLVTLHQGVLVIFILRGPGRKGKTTTNNEIILLQHKKDFLLYKDSSS